MYELVYFVMDKTTGLYIAPYTISAEILTQLTTQVTTDITAVIEAESLTNALVRIFVSLLSLLMIVLTLQGLKMFTWPNFKGKEVLLVPISFASPCGKF